MKNNKRFVYLFFVTNIICTSCVSFKPISDIETKPQSKGERLEAYVVNKDDFKYEYKVLRFSNKYVLVKDSTNSVVCIELKQMKAVPIGCVTPQATVLLFTLGFYPVSFIEGYNYEYELINGSSKETINCETQIEKVVSWYHLFSLKKNRKKAIGLSI